MASPRINIGPALDDEMRCGRPQDINPSSNSIVSGNSTTSFVSQPIPVRRGRIFRLPSLNGVDELLFMVHNRVVEDISLMEGTTFELRPTGPHYPLTLNERLTQGDNYRHDHAALQAELRSIRQFYLTPYAGPHTGDHSDCMRCNGLNRQVKKAYRDWYLSDEPGRWYSKLFDYKTELTTMFDNPDQYTLTDIHLRAEKELRAHLKKDLCSHSPGDNDQVAEYKEATAKDFESGKPVHKILEEYMETQFKFCPKSDLVDFIVKLNATTTDEERIPIYINYYCTDLWTDSSNIKHFKTKYSRMFEQGVPYDKVVATMRKEIASTRETEISDLQRRLNELNLAQSAHLKAKAKKAEKDQMKEDMVARDERKALCNYHGCLAEIDLASGQPIYCALCDWIAKLVPEDHRQTHYCSLEHATEDNESHDRSAHTCLAVSTNSCTSEPVPGPPGFEYSGMCRDCMERGRKAFFCSQECYTANVEAHRNDQHPVGEEGEIGGQDELELFEMPRSMNYIEGEGDTEMKGV